MYEVELEKYKGLKSRGTCPSCRRPHHLSQYVNKKTGEYIAEGLVGRCSNEIKCGYHYTPKQYFIDNPNRSTRQNAFPSGYRMETPQTQSGKGFQRNVSRFPTLRERKQETEETTTQFLPLEMLERSVSAYSQNHFYRFLLTRFGPVVANWLCEDFLIGSSKHWPGATAFWQVDTQGNVRQVKVILYDPATGKRDKGKGCYFAGKEILRSQDAAFKQSFFGEYRLNREFDKPLALVESEKTAVAASVFMPEFAWLATGGVNGCKWTDYDVCKVFEGKTVVLFPDLNAFDKWSEKAETVRSLVDCRIMVSDFLEKNATTEQRASGLDIADFLLMNCDSTGLALTDAGYPIIFDYQI